MLHDLVTSASTIIFFIVFMFEFLHLIVIVCKSRTFKCNTSSLDEWELRIAISFADCGRTNVAFDAGFCCHVKPSRAMPSANNGRIHLDPIL